MTAAVKIQDFSYRYPDGTAALDGICLTIDHGRRVVLVGPNGAGKSTLLLAMAGFVRGTGKVFIDDVEVRSSNAGKIRMLLGCCMEEPDDQLFMPTLYEDVAFGPLNMGLNPEETKQHVENALRQVGLEAMARKAPHHLSAGQKRAAAIATVVSMSPKIITFDEPDGNLDCRNRNNLVRLLRSLSQTLIIATCNMRFAAAVADRAVVVDNGRIVADGPAADILYNAELMAAHGLETP
ncbi:MAG: ATP-binding cassette domain-containing protein [Planctomycetes bacterium]|nr:ATP-binding cassette domain-containing protein [Planctomycetota bacterium]